MAPANEGASLRSDVTMSSGTAQVSQLSPNSTHTKLHLTLTIPSGHQDLLASASNFADSESGRRYANGSLAGLQSSLPKLQSSLPGLQSSLTRSKSFYSLSDKSVSSVSSDNNDKAAISSYRETVSTSKQDLSEQMQPQFSLRISTLSVTAQSASNERVRRDKPDRSLAVGRQSAAKRTRNLSSVLLKRNKKPTTTTTKSQTDLMTSSARVTSALLDRRERFESGRGVALSPCAYDLKPPGVVVSDAKRGSLVPPYRTAQRLDRSSTTALDARWSGRVSGSYMGRVGSSLPAIASTSWSTSGAHSGRAMSKYRILSGLSLRSQLTQPDKIITEIMTQSRGRTETSRRANTSAQLSPRRQVSATLSAKPSDIPKLIKEPAFMAEPITLSKKYAIS